MSTTTGTHTIAIIGAGGKMGMRVLNNLQKSAHRIYYSENSPAGRPSPLHLKEATWQVCWNN